MTYAFQSELGSEFNSQLFVYFGSKLRSETMRSFIQFLLVFVLPISAGASQRGHKGRGRVYLLYVIVM